MLNTSGVSLWYDLLAIRWGESTSIQNIKMLPKSLLKAFRTAHGDQFLQFLFFCCRFLFFYFLRWILKLHQVLCNCCRTTQFSELNLWLRQELHFNVVFHYFNFSFMYIAGAPIPVLGNKCKVVLVCLLLSRTYFL